MRHLMLELDKLAESDQTELRFNPSPMCEPEPESLWHLTREKKHFSLVTLHPIEVARQITLITHSKLPWAQIFIVSLILKNQMITKFEN